MAFPLLRETPRLVYRERQGVPPQDLEGGLSGYWLISERLRQVMEEIDPDAFAFADTDYRLEDGSKGPTYFLCDVVRTLDALDEEASQLNIVISDEYEAGKYYRLTGEVRLAFNREVLKIALPWWGVLRPNVQRCGRSCRHRHGQTIQWALV